MLSYANSLSFSFIFNSQTWDWYQSFRLSLGKNTNKVISQNYFCVEKSTASDNVLEFGTAVNLRVCSHSRHQMLLSSHPVILLLPSYFYTSCFPFPCIIVSPSLSSSSLFFMEESLVSLLFTSLSPFLYPWSIFILLYIYLLPSPSIFISPLSLFLISNFPSSPSSSLSHSDPLCYMKWGHWGFRLPCQEVSILPLTLTRGSRGPLFGPAQPWHHRAV